VIERVGADRPARVQPGRALAVAVRHWWLAFVLLLPSTLVAMLTAIPVFLGAHIFSALGPWVLRAAEGGYLEVALEVSASSAAGRLLGEPPPPEVAGVARSLAVAALGVLLGVFWHGLAYNVLAGGVLERLAGTPRFSFWNACQYWAWPMVRFGVLALLGLLTLGGAGVALIAMLPGGGLASLLAKAFGGVLWLALVNGLLEFGRASMVIRRDPSAARALARALALPARPVVFVQAAALWAMLATVAAAYWSLAGAVATAIPATSVAAAFSAQQVVAALGAWLKLIRLAVAVEVAFEAAETLPVAIPALAPHKSG
jgi:hypothetical protein